MSIAILVCCHNHDWIVDSNFSMGIFHLYRMEKETYTIDWLDNNTVLMNRRNKSRGTLY